MKNEKAVDWLRRVVRESNNPLARELAQNALDEWFRLLDSWKRRGVHTRRSLWDLLSGLLQQGPNGYKWNTTTTVMVSGDDIFHFPIFSEACDYRGRAHPSGAVKTGVIAFAHRTVQKAKWGNDVLKT
jgi:hypothetical protein